MFVRIVGVTLDIAPHMLLDFRKRTEKRSVVVTMMGDELVMAHLRLAAEKDGHFNHWTFQCERYSYTSQTQSSREGYILLKKKVSAYHHGDLKAAMIRAALELVGKKGPRGFSLNEASRAAGVSVSAPYNHFKDKDALLIEIVLLGNRTLESELRAAAESGETARERLLAVYLAYIGFARRHPDLFAVMFQSGIDKTPYPAVRASAAAAFEVAAELAAQIEPSPATAQELASAIWTMAHGFATLSAEGSLTRVGGSDKDAFAEGLARRLISHKARKVRLAT